MKEMAVIKKNENLVILTDAEKAIVENASTIKGSVRELFARASDLRDMLVGVGPDVKVVKAVKAARKASTRKASTEKGEKVSKTEAVAQVLQAAGKKMTLDEILVGVKKKGVKTDRRLIGVLVSASPRFKRVGRGVYKLKK